MPSIRQLLALFLLFFGGTTAAVGYAYATVTIPDPNPTTLLQNNVYYWSDGTVLATDGSVNRQNVTLAQVPADVRWDFIAAENSVRLLFPTFGDARLPDDAAVPLTAALAALTLIEEPAEVAGMLLENQGQWEPAHWRLADAIWINDGGHSYRNPCNAFALPEKRLREINNALNGEERRPHRASD
ncbi:hypothetical protein ABZ357_13715 [Streptomyces sp. NPDC005917]|uniref:hypothetical protein n=1 Tax=unclassified Streptomyces TaxID=2593676 RepID=UPI0033CCBA94